LRILSALGVAAALAAGPIASAVAHPHVWIDYAATIQCQGDTITGVRIAWTFDEMYSASLFHDYTSRPKGPLAAADVAELEKGAFQDTAEDHYFTDIVLDGTARPVTRVTDFDASYDGRKMTYRFTVPLAVKAGPGAHSLDIDSFDTEFYIDFELVKHEPATIRNGARLDLSCAATPVSKNTTTFGPLDTHIVRCQFQGAA
jgi:ABC-type uncharacterized transport system substrate-binding protein